MIYLASGIHVDEIGTYLLIAWETWTGSCGKKLTKDWIISIYFGQKGNQYINMYAYENYYHNTYTYAATWGWLKYCNPNYTLFSHSSFTNNFNKLTTKIKLFLIKAKRHKVWIKENNNIYGYCFVRNFSMRDYFIFLSWLRCDIVKLKHKYNI